jgi:hypothetical protein
VQDATQRVMHTATLALSPVAFLRCRVFQRVTSPARILRGKDDPIRQWETGAESSHRTGTQDWLETRNTNAGTARRKEKEMWAVIRSLVFSREGCSKGKEGWKEPVPHTWAAEVSFL